MYMEVYLPGALDSERHPTRDTAPGHATPPNLESKPNKENKHKY